MTAGWWQKAAGVIALGWLSLEVAAGCGGETFTTAFTATSGGRSDGVGGSVVGNGGSAGASSSGASSRGGTAVGGGGLAQAGALGGTSSALGGASGGAGGVLGGVAGVAGSLRGGALGLGGLSVLGGGGGVAGSGGSGGSVGGVSNSAGSGGAAPAISTDRLLLWLDAQRGVTEMSGAVTAWADQSGNGLHASQPLAAARPLRVSASGGLSMIEFDGIDDFLSLAAGFADFREGVSFFALVEVAEDDGCVGILELSNGTELDDINFGRQMGAPHYEVLADYFHGPAGVFEVGERYTVGLVHDTGRNAEMRLNGLYLLVHSLPLPANLMRYDNFLGRTLYQNCSGFSGRIGEVILYARGMGDPERIEVERYLANKWH